MPSYTAVFSMLNLFFYLFFVLFYPHSQMKTAMSTLALGVNMPCHVSQLFLQNILFFFGCLKLPTGIDAFCYICIHEILQHPFSELRYSMLILRHLGTISSVQSLSRVQLFVTP